MKIGAIAALRSLSVVACCLPIAFVVVLAGRNAQNEEPSPVRAGKSENCRNSVQNGNGINPFDEITRLEESEGRKPSGHAGGRSSKGGLENSRNKSFVVSEWKETTAYAKWVKSWYTYRSRFYRKTKMNNKATRKTEMNNTSNTIVRGFASLVTTCCVFTASADVQTNAQVAIPPPVLSDTAPVVPAPAPAPVAPPVVAPVAPPVVAPSVTSGTVGTEVVVSAQPEFVKGLTGKAYNLNVYQRGRRKVDPKRLIAELANPDNAPIVFTDDNSVAFTTLSKKANLAEISYNTIQWDGFLDVKRSGSYTFVFRAANSQARIKDVLQLSVGGRNGTACGQEGRITVELKAGKCPFRFLHVGGAGRRGELHSFADVEIFYYLNGAPGQPRKLTPGGGYLFREPMLR